MAISKKMLEGLSSGNVTGEVIGGTSHKDDTQMSQGPQDKVGADITKDLKVPAGVTVKKPLQVRQGTEPVPTHQGTNSVIKEGGDRIKLVLPNKALAIPTSEAPTVADKE